MAKTELTVVLEKSIQREILKPLGVFGCPEVTIGWYGTQRVDYMSMDSKEIFRCYEIKVSKSDFKSKHGHNFVGHFNYYVMPLELYEKVQADIPKEIGVYTWNNFCLELTKRPKRQELKVSIDVLKNSMIRSLYRDTSKGTQYENIEYMTKLKSKVARLERDLSNSRQYLTAFQRALYKELGHVKYLGFKDKYNL